MSVSSIRFRQWDGNTENVVVKKLCLQIEREELAYSDRAAGHC